MFKAPWIVLFFGFVLLGFALIFPSAGKTAGEGDSVTINYALMLEDGTVYDSSMGGEPLTVTLGQGILLPAFEEEVIGMRIGDFKTFILPPEEAYGNHRPEMIGTFDRDMLPQGMEPEIGRQIQANLKDGTQMVAVITSFTDTTITLDANHPLAGESLTFDIVLVGIGNDMTPAAPNRTAMLGWLMLASGPVVAGYLFFKSRRSRISTVAKKRLGIGAKIHGRIAKP